MQRLIIKNFGPIKDLDMEVKDFMLFIGPQASGKSTIAKAVYFFKSLKEDVLEYFWAYIINNEIEDEFNFAEIFIEKFWEYWREYVFNEESLIEFFYSKNISIKFKFSIRSYQVNASEKFIELLTSTFNLLKKYIEEQKTRTPLTETQIEKVGFESRKHQIIVQVGKQVNQLFNDEKEVLFIPAVRTFATVLSPHVNQFNALNPDDYLMEKFMMEVNSIKSSFKKSLEQLAEEKFLLTKEKNIEVAELAQKLIRNILRGDYTYDNTNGERLRINENEYLPLNYISSGQQESLWILLLIYLKTLYKKNIFLVIEEPEAHLFPEAQKHIMELVALLFNTTDSQVMITTHSPYILSSVNNLLYAGKLGKTKNGKVNALIDSKLWLDVDRTDAMYVHRPGTPPESIMDREQAMIKVERLDEISEVINAEFDKLMDIEFE